MTVKILTASDFKEMPWKNGGGSTTELYRINAPGNESFLFRLSKASVKTSGPFSIFPNIDRILILLKGKGFKLKFTAIEKTLTKEENISSFKGEESIHCDLLDDECVDFNIMTDRNFATSSVKIHTLTNNSTQNFMANSDLQFIYAVESDELYTLDKGESYFFTSKEEINLITIDVKLI